MLRTRVKICGITRDGDAVCAAEAGADAIGIIQDPQARRYVPSHRAERILYCLPAFVTPVAVYVNQSIEHIRQTAAELGIQHVQLHGDEPPSMAAELRPLGAIKALRVTKNLAAELQRYAEIPVLGFVFDTASHRGIGGTGEVNDWELIKQVQGKGLIQEQYQLTVAGGLTPENVGDVIRLIRPWAVDVSSGVESSIGIKSIEKMRAFIAAVREADSM